ncbi:HAD family hydrolase [Arthrobacter sp. NPDC090010]|uniref:HAD family hydrolase n=1 Tax=Arthrobacter sp. NPDC090010 TaxID=3363942 RepID=UPI00380263F4
MTTTGVLFDIDDTLVDLASAMTTALGGSLVETLSPRDARRLGLGAGVPAGDDAEEYRLWRTFSEHFVQDLSGSYDDYLAGRLSFVEMRVVRLHRASALLDLAVEDDLAQRWVRRFAELAETGVTSFPDVPPMLDLLDESGIPYGAVSNNVEAFQRAKLGYAGLERIDVVVGTDTLGVTKPDPAIFHEGARLIGVEPADCWYVGDNPVVDHDGSVAAGLRGVYLNRGVSGSGSSGNSPVPGGMRLTGERTMIRSLTELPALLGLDVLRGEAEPVR